MSGDTKLSATTAKFLGQLRTIRLRPILYEVNFSKRANSEQERRALKAENESLEAYLANKVFAGEHGLTMAPDKEDVEGFETFMERYKQGMVIERAAVDGLR